MRCAHVVGGEGGEGGGELATGRGERRGEKKQSSKPQTRLSRNMDDASGPSERFEVVDAGDGTIALKVGGKYCTDYSTPLLKKRVGCARSNDGGVHYWDRIVPWEVGSGSDGKMVLSGGQPPPRFCHLEGDTLACDRDTIWSIWNLRPTTTIWRRDQVPSDAEVFTLESLGKSETEQAVLETSSETRESMLEELSETNESLLAREMGEESMLTREMGEEHEQKSMLEMSETASKHLSLIFF